MRKLIALVALALCVAAGQEAFAQPAPDGQGQGGRGGFGRMDNNNDGKISADEFRGPQEVFASIDTNKDGSLSQEEMQAGRDQMRGAFQRGGGGRGFMDMLKEQLGATDEEWTVLEPRIQKVQEAQAKLRPAGFGGGRGGQGGPGGFGGPGGPGGRGQGGPGGPGGPGMNQQLPEAQALRATLENKEAPADEIKTKLAALREARKKAQDELEAARKDLQDVVTARQEAVLVSFSILD